MEVERSRCKESNRKIKRILLENNKIIHRFLSFIFSIDNRGREKKRRNAASILEFLIDEKKHTHTRTRKKLERLRFRSQISKVDALNKEKVLST